VSSVRCATGYRDPALRRRNAPSPLASALVLLVALYAFLAPAGAALAATRGQVQPQVASSVLHAEAGNAAVRPAVETIRRMPAPVLRNTDTSSALPPATKIASEIARWAPLVVLQERSRGKRGAEASVRAPPVVTDILV
jgi:hypothetical protein